MKKLCPICNTEIKTARGKYCSFKCCGESKKKSITCFCILCGNEFLAWPSTVKKGAARHCSSECRVKSSINKFKVKCLYCEIEFFTHPSSIKAGQGKYCKNECRLKHKNEIKIQRAEQKRLIPKRPIHPSITKKCLTCNADFTAYISNINRGLDKYCSQSCYNTKLTWPEKFFKSISLSNDINQCWIWIGKKDKDGYGVLYLNKNTRAHRYSYAIHYGNFDQDLLVCHKCDVPSCVNPDHLFLGTAWDNAKDRDKKGRGRKYKK